MLRSIIVALAVVGLVACDSTRPTQSLKSSKTIATAQDVCPLDVVGQWEGEGETFDWWRRHIVQFCEDGTWTNINGFSGTWSLDGNVLTITNRITNSTGIVFIARPETGDRLYLNLNADQLKELEILFLGAAEYDDDQFYARSRLSFRKISD